MNRWKLIVSGLLIAAAATAVRTIDLSCTASKIVEVNHRLEESPLTPEQKQEVKAQTDAIVNRELQPLWEKASRLEQQQATIVREEVERITGSDYSLQGRDQTDPEVLKKLMQSPRLQDQLAANLDTQEGLNGVEKKLKIIALSTPSRDDAARVESAANLVAANNRINVTDLDDSKGYKDLLATFAVTRELPAASDGSLVMSHALGSESFDTPVKEAIDLVRGLGRTVQSDKLGVDLGLAHIRDNDVPAENRSSIMKNPASQLARSVKNHAGKNLQDRLIYKETSRVLKTIEVPPPTADTPKEEPTRLEKLADQMQEKAGLILKVIMVKKNKSTENLRREKESVFGMSTVYNSLLLLAGSVMLCAVPRRLSRARPRNCRKRATRVLRNERTAGRDCQPGRSDR